MQPVYKLHKQYITCLQNPSRFFTRLIALTAIILFPAIISAQNLTTSSFVEGDFIIPTGINLVTIKAIGGDGGSAYSVNTGCQYSGGKAASIKASFPVYASLCPAGQFNLISGGKLRFVRGKNGSSGTEGNGQDFPIACGGGGAAVLYQAPGTTNWKILLVAGGGGGAFIYRGLIGTQCLGGKGFDASLNENGTNGGGNYPGIGGNNGNGGNAGGFAPGDGGGGGGAYTAGGEGSIAGLGGGSGFPSGGIGGSYAVGTSTVNGGTGFGGGGARNIAGGGGGGYSGGGGGSRDGYGAGGGGGSFVATGALNVQMSITGADYFDGGTISTSLTAGTNVLPVTRLYVNQNASGNNNGTSWVNAYTKLQDALTATVCQAEIWVAKGTYYPDEGTGFTNNDRTSSFKMKSGVALYGGFVGNETQLSQRNFFTNQTFLSGDLSKDDGTYTDATFANYGENAYHVVRSENTNSTAILNGFIIHSGNANSSFPDNSGGGIYSSASGTQISNCTVYFNQAEQGGGLYNYNSSPTIANCFFKSNKVVLGAAGVYVYTNSNPFFYNCVFQGNYVGTTTTDGGGGGAILNAVNSAPQYINCTISGNFANTGGAVYNLNNAQPIFYNSIIWQNKSTKTLPISSDGTSGMTYFNCLVQGINLTSSLGSLDGTITPIAGVFTMNDDPTLAPQATGILTLVTGSPAIDKGNNGYLANVTDIAGNPRFVGADVDMGAYEFQGNVNQATITTVTSSLGSACANTSVTFTANVTSVGIAVTTGTITFTEGSTVLATNIVLDANGHAAFSNSTLAAGSHAILATYNASTGFTSSSASVNQIIGGPVLYVNTAATGLGNGTSWVDAYKNLQDALANTCSGVTQIWVAKGTYFPDEGGGKTNNDRTAAFAMKNNLVIYGGFTGNETNVNQRNWRLNETILSGDINKNDGAGFSNYDGNSIHVFLNYQNGLDNTAVLNGFTIQGGYASSEAINGNNGAGMYNRDVSPVITNCTFTKNKAGSSGGGIYYSRGSVVVNNCRFVNNYAGYGAGITGFSGTVTINNTIFNGNTGSALSNYFGTNNLTNCTLANNTENANDANASAVHGSSIDDIFSTANAVNCIFWGAGPNFDNRSTYNITYSIVKDGDPGNNNSTLDPQFVDIVNGNLRLLACSPAINTGDNNANTATVDLDGNNRIINTTIDMGAYEFTETVELVPLTIICPVAVTINGCGTDAIISSSKLPYATGTSQITGLQFAGEGGTINTGTCAVATISYKDNIDNVSSTVTKMIVLRTFTVTDVSGKVFNCVQTITLEDKTAPTIITKNITVQLTTGGVVNIKPADVDNGSSDACSSISLGLDKTNFDCKNIGANTVLLTVTDVKGNEASATAIVTVVDNQAPVITSNGDKSVYNNVNVCGATVTVSASATDNCSVGTVTGVRSDALALTAFYPVGTTTIKWNVTDVNGNPAAEVIQTVVVTDNQAPVITSNGDKSVYNNVNVCGATITVSASATDNCSVGTVTGVRSDALALTAFYPVGTTTIKWNVTDVNGNPAAEVTQTVVVTDNQAPVITTNGDKSVYNDVNVCGATVTVSASATDNCSVGAVTGVRSDGLALTAVYPVGTTTIKWNVTDVNGNAAAEVTQTVVVTDNQKPTVFTNNISILLDVNGAAIITAAQVNNVSTDNCSIPANGYSLDKTTFNCSNVGTNTVTLTVTDVNGNSQTANASVTVQDNIAPIASCKSIEVYLDQNGTVTISPQQVDNGSTDACGVTLSLNKTSFNTTNVGANTVALTVSDPSGNSSICTATVTVKKRPVTLTYTGDNSEQYSDQQTLTAILKDQLTNAVLSSKTISFTIGIQSAIGITNASGIAATTLMMYQNVGSYNVVSSFAGDATYDISSAANPFYITKENAVTDYTGPEFISVPCATCATTSILLSASVRDTTAVYPLNDKYPGDIRKARVKFINLNTMADISGWLTPGLVSSTDTTRGIVSFNWTVTLPSTSYDVYSIGVVVDNNGSAGNYIGSSQAVLSVSRSSLTEFITGGGDVIPTSSNGQYASDAGRKLNFGFNVKYNKSGTNLQGNMNVVFRRGGRLYQIKATSLSGLSINSTNPCSKKAIFSSKANLNDITNPALPVTIYGGITLQVTMTDNGEPGNTDMIGITLLNGSSLVYSSNWISTKTTELVLNGGNLVVRSGVNCSSNTFAALTPTITPEILETNSSISVKAYPNPFSNHTSISYTLPEAMQISLAVYDSRGQKLAQLAEGRMSAGRHEARFDGSRLAAGIYHYFLQVVDAKGRINTLKGKMVLVR
jgi:hypothetical protein